MDSRFTYLLDRIADAPLEVEPFPHLYLTDFLSEQDFKEVLGAAEVALPPAEDLDELFAALDAAGYERIDFPGCVRSKEEYVRWLEEAVDQEGTNPNCEAQGLAFRLTEPRNETIVALDAFFRTPELEDLLIERFDITLPVTMEGGVQKYLHGYEISPHPDIRKKALTWMLNVNPAEGSEELDIHTHYLRLRPEWAYISEIWRRNPTVETCWLPWAWCETVRRQVENNSIVFFAPRWDTVHAVRAHYDHLPTQRTQFYGNLWYDPADRPITARPGHEDLDFHPREVDGADGDLEARLAAAEQRADELQHRLDGILGHPAVRLARRARRLVPRRRGTP